MLNEMVSLCSIIKEIKYRRTKRITERYISVICVIDKHLIKLYLPFVFLNNGTMDITEPIKYFDLINRNVKVLNKNVIINFEESKDLILLY